MPRDTRLSTVTLHTGTTLHPHAATRTLRALTLRTTLTEAAHAHSAYAHQPQFPHTHSCTCTLRSGYAPPTPPAALTQSAYACIIDYTIHDASRCRRPWKRKGKRAQS
jgi:hypothetical protein